MAESKKITYDQLVDPAAFPKLFSEAEKLIAILIKGQQEISKMQIATKDGLVGGSPQTTDQVAQLQALIARVKELESAKTKLKDSEKVLTIETAKAQIQQQEFNKQIKATAKDQLGLISSYKKESETLNNLRNSYKDLLVTEKANTAEAKALLAQVTALDSKLKAVDATVGQHNRNVGNYKSALTDVKTGLLQIGGALGIAFGVHQIKDFAAESIHAHLEAQKNARGLYNAVKQNTVIYDRLIKQSEELQDKSIFSDDDIQIAQKQLAVYGLTGDQIAKLTPQIVDMASKMDMNLSEATEKSIAAINGQTKGLKQAGIAFKDAGSKTENFALLTEKLTKFQGASAEALETTIGKAKRLENAFDNIKETIGEYLVNEGAQILDNFEVVFGAKSFDALALTRAKDKAIAVMDEVNSKTLLKAQESEANRLKAIADTEQNIRALSEAGLKATDLNNKKANYAAVQNQIKLLNDLKTLNDKQAIEDDATAGAKEGKEGKTDWELAQEEADRLMDIDVKHAHDEIALRKKQAKELRDIEIDSEEQAKKDAEQMYKDQLDAELKAFDDAKHNQEIKDKYEEEQKKKRLAERQKEYAMAMETADTLFGIYKEGQDRISAERLAAIDHEMDQNKSAMQIQAELAAAGMSNTLAFEMQKQDELEKARVQELERQKKIAKQQEVLELTLAFFKAYQNYIGKDMKSGEALIRASGDVLTAKLLGKAIAGSALDGTEDTGPGGSLDADGGMLWKLHPHERVLTKEQNEKLGGLSNDQLVANALMFDNIYKSNYNSSLSLSDVSGKQQVSESLTNALINEIKDLKQVVKDKPENSTNLDNLGNVIKIRIEKGIRTVTKKQTFIN